MASTTSRGSATSTFPLIHNVMNTDVVIGVSDKATDGLNAVFNTEIGKAYLARRLGLSEDDAGEALDVRAVEHRQCARRDQTRQALTAWAPTAW